VAMMVLLVEAGAEGVSVLPASVPELARLGVTSLTLTRDEATVGIVLDGRAFDPARSGDEAVAAMGLTASEARILRPLAQMSVSTAPTVPSQGSILKWEEAKTARG